MQEEIQNVFAAIPEPSEPLQVKLLQNIVGAVNDLTAAVVGKEGAAGMQVTWEPPPDERGKAPTRWEGKPPLEVVVPLYGVGLAVEAASQGETNFAQKYAIAPADLSSNNGLRKVDGQLMRMKKDKKLIKALAPSDDLAPPPPPAPPPEQFSPEDEELMQMKM